MKFFLTVNTQSPAFHPNPGPELARILRAVATRLDTLVERPRQETALDSATRGVGAPDGFDYADGGWVGHMQTVVDSAGIDVGRYAIKDLDKLNEDIDSEGRRWTLARRRVPVGTPVRLSRDYLRNVGHVGPSQWTTVSCPCRSCEIGDWVAVNEPLARGPWLIVRNGPHGREYWENTDGWLNAKGDAAEFSEAEHQTLNLPIGGEWAVNYRHVYIRNLEQA